MAKWSRTEEKPHFQLKFMITGLKIKWPPDNRNARAVARISKAEYVKQYHGIQNKTVQVKEKKNVRE